MACLLSLNIIISNRLKFKLSNIHKKYSIISIGYSLNDDYNEVHELANNFSNNSLVQNRQKWDEEEYFPVEVLREASKLGFGGICVDQEFGGSGLTRLHSSIIFETLSSGCVGTAAYLSIHNMVALIINKYGNIDLKNKYLEKLVSCELLSSYCLTEPDYGSDSSNIQCRAIKNGDHFILNGSKAFISGAGSTDILLVMARTGNPGPNGISCFLVESNMKGISFGKKEKKLGWNCQPTRSIFFDDCRIHQDQLIGIENEGFKIAMSALDGGRLNIASCSLGAGYSSLKYCIDYINERKQFGTKLSNNQYIQFKIAELSTKLIASRSIVRDACKSDPSLNLNEPFPKEMRKNWSAQIAMAKYFATENCFQISNECLQFFGGYGYLKTYPIEQFVRDCRVHQILEGTNEVMKMIIYKQLSI